MAGRELVGEDSWEKLCLHLERHKLLRDCQHWCVQEVLIYKPDYVFEEVMKMIAEGSMVGVVHIVLGKARLI